MDDRGELGELRQLIGEDVEVLGELGGSSRSSVHRVRTADTTVIVKRFLGNGGGFAREAAALSVLPPDAPAPRLLLESTQPPTVVLSDAGTGPSVADDLLDTDPTAARAALHRWAQALARLHTVTATRGDAFRTALAARTDQPTTVLADELDAATTELDAHCEQLGVPVPPEAWTELRTLHASLATGPAILSPGDTCPDNNIATPQGQILIDFEAAQWQHPAWDVAYLTVPWPSCWCSWRLPVPVSEQTLSHYQQEATIPWATSPTFRADIEAAHTVWAVMTTAWFLPRALADDPPPADPRKQMPTRRSQILNRLQTPASRSDSPALAAVATSLRAVLIERWGNEPLPMAPAFRSEARNHRDTPAGPRP
ncbi:phosphotransferase [Actinoplanes sp. LDG1-06]|uniref:Phosphotransferase n=1 Tax=Paractinoplanes ovalisporus TaxID=2810368 RepID=A0ABS2ATI8_9ACTN|nr:phosphotransferase [Actinoplanes ovalisporus]MBM2623172.1 phosphotransferase [Actinoplanes ovalisporus]